MGENDLEPSHCPELLGEYPLSEVLCGGSESGCQRADWNESKLIQVNGDRRCSQQRGGERRGMSGEGYEERGGERGKVQSAKCAV